MTVNISTYITYITHTSHTSNTVTAFYVNETQYICLWNDSLLSSNTHTHTHTHLYSYVFSLFVHTVLNLFLACWFVGLTYLSCLSLLFSKNLSQEAMLLIHIDILIHIHIHIHTSNTVTAFYVNETRAQ